MIIMMTMMMMVVWMDNGVTAFSSQTCYITTRFTGGGRKAKGRHDERAKHKHITDAGDESSSGVQRQREPLIRGSEDALRCPEEGQNF